MSEDAGELAEIRRELRMHRLYIDDDALRAEVGEWIERSHDRSDADTARQFLEEMLNELLDGHEMYASPEVARGEDGFPDACSDCRHYGSACPVLRDRTETQWRERELKEAETEQEARRVYQQQARDVDCIRIPEFLSTWDNDHRDLLEDGQRLLSRVEDYVHDEADQADADDATAVADGGDA